MNEFQKKVKRYLELQQQMSALNQIKKMCEKYGLVELNDTVNSTLEEKKKEFQPLVNDPYIYDKAEGLKDGGIL